MTLEVRRIVTGHDAAGKAVIASDERMVGSTRAGRGGIARCEIWSTNRMPVDNAESAAAEQKKGFVVRIVEFAPGSPKFMHRTETLDYAIVLSGECDMELDNGKTVHVRQGDVVVQRGTMHAWVNTGTQPCVFAFVLIDADPAEAGGQSLRTHYPA